MNPPLTLPSPHEGTGEPPVANFLRALPAGSSVTLALLGKEGIQGRLFITPP